ncbi:hypothetical protein AKG33_04305 [Dichelobacter nodosus]|nr:hypothetical protein AKG33_04305 [Dichelobacter nodosus]
MKLRPRFYRFLIRIYKNIKNSLKTCGKNFSLKACQIFSMIFVLTFYKTFYKLHKVFQIVFKIVPSP